MYSTHSEIECYYLLQRFMNVVKCISFSTGVGETTGAKEIGGVGEAIAFVIYRHISLKYG